VTCPDRGKKSLSSGAPIRRDCVKRGAGVSPASFALIHRLNQFLNKRTQLAGIVICLRCKAARNYSSGNITRNPVQFATLSEVWSTNLEDTRSIGPYVSWKSRCGKMDGRKPTLRGFGGGAVQMASQSASINATAMTTSIMMPWRVVKLAFTTVV
jgi:hypothetical protein